MASNTYLGTRVAILKERLLSETFFSPYIESAIDSEFTRQTGISVTEDLYSGIALERSLMHTLLIDLAIIRRPLSGAERDFFSMWAQRFEIFNLKTIIRGKYQKQPYEKIKPQLQDIPSFSTLDHESLLGSENLTELLRHIEKGTYSAIARQARRVFESEHDPHAVEAAIDQLYYSRLLKQLNKLPQPDRKVMTNLLGVQIDKLNISWLVRYRFTYELSPSETYYHLIHSGHYLKRNTLLLLSEKESFEELLESLPEQIKKHLMKCDNSLQMEQHLERFVRIKAREQLKNNNSTIARALGYLLLRECDLNHIRTLLMGKKLDLSPQLLRSSLGHRAEAFSEESEHV